MSVNVAVQAPSPPFAGIWRTATRILEQPASVVFAGAFALYAAISWWLVLVLQVTHDDGVSRTALGSFVLYGRDPHLASIGFVWNPLPSVVQLPLLPLLRPFGLQLLAGPLQSSGFMAGAVAVLWQYLGLFGAPARLRLALTGLFALNPMILLYAANGLSEASLIFFMLGGAYYLMRWFGQGHYANLIGAGFMTAGAFSTRYEAVPLAAGGC
ncbi:MAG: hypothetical protein JO247_18660, partial [Chloroflexi bacterium]|nr:hypothetical protein [Chloroflexota bacterium]